MNKAKLNYLVDASIAVLFTVVSITGLILFFFLPSGLKQGGSREVLGIAKQVWTQIHDWSGIILVAFISAHFILHWQWIVYATKNTFQKKQIYSEIKNNK